jgi:hypothetical protein
VAGALAANAVVVSILGCALVLDTFSPDAYAAAVQEDEPLEWANFWAFALAAAGFVQAARVRCAREGRLPWATLATAAFCAFVALGEISWGQRLLGYRPPEYFLAANFQQELNLHNLVETSARKWTLAVVIGGFGIALPLASRVRGLERLLARLGAPRPPGFLVPAFAAILVFYQWYPVRFSGEWVELALGVGFLLVATEECRRWRSAAEKRDTGPLVALAVLAGTLALGAATARSSRVLAREDPARREAAVRETDALREAFVSGGVEGRCGAHKRLYSFVEDYDRDELRHSAFAGLAEPERAAYFLDPWNSPYWIRHLCTQEDGRSTLVVYSFGPDRRRNSLDVEIEGDDVGARAELERLDR